MKRGMLVAALVVLASPLALLSAGGKGAVSGEYVEARTAEVFTGGCIMGSEAETVGKNAVLAWMRRTLARLAPAPRVAAPRPALGLRPLLAPVQAPVGPALARGPPAGS